MKTDIRIKSALLAITMAFSVVLNGQVVINEFLARNNTDTVNEYGNHEDWIELINLSEQPADLFGLYLTDDYDNPDKFAFPENTIIQPGSYLMIWADEEDTVSSFLHANFKLSAGGEVLMLSNGIGLVLDSLTFGPQSPDISWGRCPDGIGFFDALDFPTFGTENYCPEGISGPDPADYHIVVAPNPAMDVLSVSTDIPGGYYFEIFSLTGTVVLSRLINNSVESVDIREITAGLYFYIVKDKYGRLSSGKILKL